VSSQQDLLLGLLALPPHSRHLHLGRARVSAPRVPVTQPRTCRVKTPRPPREPQPTIRKPLQHLPSWPGTEGDGLTAWGERWPSAGKEDYWNFSAKHLIHYKGFAFCTMLYISMLTMFIDDITSRSKDLSFF